MSTTIAIPVERPRQLLAAQTLSGPAMVCACAAVAILLLGYHPWSEDGGIYASAIALRLHPELFRAERGFAIAHTGRSLFVTLVSGLVRLVPGSASTLIFAAYAASIVATMAAAHGLARALFREARARRWSLVLFAVSLGVPVAGTSLYLADPYLTARSASTPLLLWALTLLVRRRTPAAWLCVAVSFALHPLMTAWAVLLLLLFLARRSTRPALHTGSLAAALFAGMALVVWLAPADHEAVRAASLSRTYWFLAGWAPYEWVGILAPTGLLATMSLRRFARVSTPPAHDLAMAAATATALVTLASLLLIHMDDRSMLLARLQPLRSLHMVYVVFVLLLGGYASGLRRNPWPGVVFVLSAAAGLGAMQRALYRELPHIQLPSSAPVNGYEQAFLWARTNTPVDALFALDAEYTTAAGEEAQVFRAVAWRSALPDAAKDGGIASVMPALAEDWLKGSRAQAGLATMQDAERLARLQPLGVSWIVLPATSPTRFACPYANAAAKVCRLP